MENDIQIFLSYASQDQERVLSVYEFLIKNGFPNTWIDCKKLLPGQPWEFEIQRNLKKSEIVIFFLSHTSVNKRGFVQKELKAALNYLEEKLSGDTYIIPIKLDSDVIVPAELLRFQYLDLNQSNSFNLLKQSLKDQISKLGYEPYNPADDVDEIHVTKKIFKESWQGLPGYEVEYAVPIFHSTKYENISEITKVVEASFLRRLHHYRLNKIDQLPASYSWSQNEFQRTHTFDAHYGSVFHENNFLSIHYSIHWYGAGAAHPNHHFETYNFLLNPLIEIDRIQELFMNLKEPFAPIRDYVRDTLLSIPLETGDKGNQIGEEKMLDREWVERGTESWDSFQAFSFSKEGLEISFPPYQVGAYACGSHFVTVPYKLFHSDLKNEIKHALSVAYLY